MHHDIRPVIAPEFWELIQKNCDNSLRGRDLSSKAQQEQHEEEQNTPERGNWHLRHSLWVGYEGQPDPLGHHLVHGGVLEVGHVADDSEDDKPGKDTGHTVTTGHDDGVSEDVVVEVIVAGEGDHNSPGDSDGEEYLRTSICPNLETNVF